jgi:primosomal protein N'
LSNRSRHGLIQAFEPDIKNYSYFAFSLKMPDTQFADIILPLALRGRFTYRIPVEFADRVKPGVRVLVQFGGRQFYSGIVCSINDRSPEIKNIKTITRVLDEIPLINESQLKLWFWISDYYLCGEGEVMKAALPSEASINSYKPRFETFVKLARQFSEKELNEILDNLSKARKQQ